MKNRKGILPDLAKLYLLLDDCQPQPQSKPIAKRSFLLGWLSLAALILGAAFMQAQVTSMSTACATYDVPNAWPMNGDTFCAYGPQHTQFAIGCNFTIGQYNCQVAYVQAEGKPNHNTATDQANRKTCLSDAQLLFSENEETYSEWTQNWQNGSCESKGTPAGVIYPPMDYPSYQPPATD